MAWLATMLPGGGAAVVTSLTATGTVTADKFRASGGTIGSPSYGWTENDTIGRYLTGTNQADVRSGTIYALTNNTGVGTLGTSGGAPSGAAWGFYLTNDQAFALTGDVNNYAPYNPGLSPLWRLTPDSAWNITGIAAPTTYGTDGAVLIIQNASTTGGRNITLVDSSGSSAAAAQILTPGAANVVIPPGGAALCIYDSTATKWRAYPLF